MPRLDRLPEASRRTLLTFPAQENDTAPFLLLRKPLSAVRLAIVTTAGLHRRGDRLFDPGDQTYRVIPSDTETADIIQSHTSIGFDRAPIMRDLNISFPIERARELAARGELGGLAPACYSFMGAQRETRRIEDETGPEVAARLRAEGADAALITPT
jgi:D-proline reductase (dithiol) PrdB